MMAWRRIGDKPWSEPVTVWSIDAYMRHVASMNKYIWENLNLQWHTKNVNKGVKFL